MSRFYSVASSYTADIYLSYHPIIVSPQCFDRPTLFSDQMSQKAIKPGSVCLIS